MRFLTALTALAVLAVAVSCEGNSAATAPSACAGLRRPGVPLAYAPARPPSVARARCLGVQYTAVIGRLGWGRLPREIRRTNSGVAAWQQRSLLYACDRCGLAGFGLAWVRAHHPDWIMHSVQGTEIHPQDHPAWVLLNFTDPKYQDAWAVHVGKSLAAGGWTGVDVIDADNDPDWSDVPLQPSNGQPLTEAKRRFDLAAALTLVRAALKLQGYSLLAENGPPDTIDFAQVNSTDAVTVRGGFARLSGSDWFTELDYYRHVAGWESGVYVGDAPGLTSGQMLYGLASFLLVAIPRDSAYVAPGDPALPLYGVHLGTPPTTQPTATGGVWTRTYPNGVVAVNPSSSPATVTVGGAGAVTLGPHSAAIDAGGHLLTGG